MEFKVLKRSKKSKARLGILKAAHGEVRTPAFVPVATQATVKTLTSEQAQKTGSQILIANTFHLHLKPGEGIVKNAGGLHKFMNWPRPLMTDSGGFQVFSLGFGMDLQVGKLLKYFEKDESNIIRKNQQPKQIKITGGGVHFSSPIDGKKLFLGPKESIKIQEALGADIIYAFDECTSPLADYEYSKRAMERTHKWAKVCIDVKKSKQAMFGIVQGSHFKDLRKQSASYIDSLGFDGYGIGGDLGDVKSTMVKILGWTLPFLNEKKPRHLLGIGYLEDMETIVKEGVDTFDCIVPTHYGRRGIVFTSVGKLNLKQTKFLKDKSPLDKKCGCFVCQSYKRNYISHLLKAKEITAMSLLTFHNLYFWNSRVEKIRQKIKDGKI